MALETYLLLVCASRHRLFLSSFATAHRERAIPDVDLGASANPPTGFRGQLLACRLPFDPQAVHKNLVHGFGDQIAKRSRFGILNGRFPAPVVRRHLGRVCFNLGANFSPATASSEREANQRWRGHT